MPDPNKTLEVLLDASIQRYASDPPVEGGPITTVFSWLRAGGSLVAPWWSRTRDVQLRNFWKQNDALSSAVYTLQSKLLSIPFHVEPRDFDVRSHVAQADLYTKNLYEMTNFGKGWFTGFAPALEDLFGQDNGLMVEVIGEGPKDGPIVGSALGIAPLDSARCTRTRNPLWPVYYTDLHGDRFKLHYTRVIMVEQMPSPIVEYNGVGYCSVSRAINAAQNLYDIATYKMEKLGSRPKRQILVGRKGLTVDNIFNAFRQADIQQDTEGLSRYSKVIAIAPDRATANSEVALDVIDLASAPDGFNEQESVTLGVYILAWAFGVDAREFWPASSSGATKADAMVQHMKARGKAIGNTIAALEKAFDRYYLPPHLKMVFDVQDDEEDAQRATIADQESATIDRDVKAGVYDVRVARQKMLQAERITQTQYDELELADGRLPGGEDALASFYSADPILQEFLALGVDDPLDKDVCVWDEPKATPPKPLAPVKESAPVIEVAPVKAKQRQWAILERDAGGSPIRVAEEVV